MISCAPNYLLVTPKTKRLVLFWFAMDRAMSDDEWLQAEEQRAHATVRRGGRKRIRRRFKEKAERRKRQARNAAHRRLTPAVWDEVDSQDAEPCEGEPAFDGSALFECGVDQDNMKVTALDGYAFRAAVSAFEGMGQ